MGLLGIGRIGGWKGICQALGRRSCRRSDLRHQVLEIGPFDLGQAAGAVLGREASRIDRLADEGPVRRINAVGLKLRHGHHFINDLRQLQPGFRTVDLRLKNPAIKVVQLLVNLDP